MNASQIQQAAKEKGGNEDHVKTSEPVQQITAPRPSIESEGTKHASPDQISTQHKKYDDPLVSESGNKISRRKQRIVMRQFEVILKEEVTQVV
jgi:hypothetical protein